MLSKMIYQKIICYNSDNNKALFEGSNVEIYISEQNTPESTTISPPPGETIIYLGIQGIPGMRFVLNKDNQNINNSIMIGATGIFELDLEDTDSSISSITFAKSDLTKLYGPKGYLIIDYVTIKEN